MGVEVIGMGGELNGYGDAMDAFRTAHEHNSRALLNVAEGKKKNEPRPAYDPNHSDNKWPVMMHHPGKGEKPVGTNLKGLEGAKRKETEADNVAALKQAKADGYRHEPYVKPQIAVLDPATEKAALLAKNQELEGKLVAAVDVLTKMEERLKALEK